MIKHRQQSCDTNPVETVSKVSDLRENWHWEKAFFEVIWCVGLRSIHLLSRCVLLTDGIQSIISVANVIVEKMTFDRILWKRSRHTSNTYERSTGECTYRSKNDCITTRPRDMRLTTDMTRKTGPRSTDMLRESCSSARWKGRHSLHVTIREGVEDSRLYLFVNGTFKRTWKIAVSKCNKVLAMLNGCRGYWSVCCRFRRCGEATSNHNQKHVVTSVMSLLCALQVSSRSFEAETYVSDGKRISKHARRASANLRDASAIIVIFFTKMKLPWDDKSKPCFWQSDNALTECWWRRRKLSFLPWTQECDMMFGRKTTVETNKLGSYVHAGVTSMKGVTTTKIKVRASITSGKRRVRLDVSRRGWRSFLSSWPRHATSRQRKRKSKFGDVLDFVILWCCVTLTLWCTLLLIVLLK